MRRLLRFLQWSWFAIAAAVIGAWLAGEVLTDRYVWSQWLWWAPSWAVLPLAIVSAAIAGPGAVRIGRMRMAWLIVAGLLLAHTCIVEHAMYRRPGAAGSDDLHVIHWNMTQKRIGTEAGPFVDALLDLAGESADVMILTDAWTARGHPELMAWVDEHNGDDRAVFNMGPFTLLSAVPIERVRWVIARDGMYVARIVLDARERYGRPLTIDAVDLPSDPSLSRADMAGTVRDAIDALHLEPADLVIGDMNIIRRSASLRTMFPMHTHAYDLAGGGYAASYHRRRPVLHIDHALAGPGTGVSRYELTDPAVGRHHAQQVWIDRLTAAENAD